MNKKLTVERTVFCGIVVICYVLFAMFYGIVPKISFPTLDINYTLLGSGGRMPGMVIDRILYPYGAQQFEAYGISLCWEVIYFFTRNAEIALSSTYLLLYSVSFMSIVFLGVKYLKNYFLTVIVIIAFFLNPYFTYNQSIPQVGFGAMLIAFSFLLDVSAYHFAMQKSERKRTRAVILFRIFSFGRLFITSIGWYTAVIIAVFSCLSLLIYFVFMTIKERKVKYVLDYFVYIILPWIIAMGIIRFITPSSVQEFKTPIEFFNGTSVDIASLLFPGSGLLVSKLIPSVQKLITDQFYLSGDATQWQNYLGYTVIICAVIGIISKTDKKSEKISVAVTGLTGLLLALGPGLKFFVTKEAAGGITYSNYLVSFDEVITMPWKFVYNIFPLNIMRTVYRWILIPRAALLLLASIGLKRLWEKGMRFRILALVLSGCLILEYYPLSGIRSVFRSHINTVQQLHSFQNDVIDKLDQYVDEGDVVAICTYVDNNNGFVIPYMMEELNAVSYAGSGDKAIVLASGYWPKAIKKLQSSADAQEIAESIVKVSKRNLCDAILVPFFDVRNESYYWGPSEETVNGFKERAEEIAAILDGRYPIYMEDYFMVILPDAVGNGYELISDTELTEQKIKDMSTLFGTYWHINLTGNNIFYRDIAVGDGNKHMYFSTYTCSVEEASFIVRYKEYDKMENLIFSDEIEVPVQEDYSLFEKSISLDKNTDHITVECDGKNVSIKNVKIQTY